MTTPDASPAAWLFAGPTLHGIAPERVARAGVTLCPPARRDDLRQLVRERRRAGATPGVIVLCDGVFHTAPAVSHAELCDALDAGWQVWGVASLGAIRAVEMQGEGMRGHGQVHALYASRPGLGDDEACLLHYPEPPWFPLTEALVNLRIALARGGARFGIETAAGQAALDELASLWFGDRTPARVDDALRRHAGADAARLAAFTSWRRARPAKQHDLAQLLRTRPWSAPRPARSPTPPIPTSRPPAA